jgi:hypothetical protein
MQRSKPEHAPLYAGPVACHTCGSLLKAIVILGRNGVQGIRYECKNEKTGCSYKVDTNVYMTAEPEAIRPDGKQV